MLNDTISVYNLLQAHQATAVPSLIILYISSLIITLIVGLSLVKHNKEKYMLIWGVSAIFMGLILLMLCLMPNLTQSIVNFMDMLK